MTIIDALLFAIVAFLIASAAIAVVEAGLLIVNTFIRRTRRLVVAPRTGL